MLELVELFHECPAQLGSPFKAVDVVGGNGCEFVLGVLLSCETNRSVVREVFEPFQHCGMECVANLVERVVVDVESIKVCC